MIDVDALRRQLSKEGQLTLSLRVRPGAQWTRFKGFMDDGGIKLDLARTPEDGKANAELVRFLAAEFAVPKANVAIVSGRTSRTKTICINAL